MHYGSISSPRSKAGEIYRFLKANMGTYFSGWDLTLQCHTTAISTHISEINMQLEGTNEEVVSDQRGKGWFYGLVTRENPQPPVEMILPAHFITKPRLVGM